MSLCLVFSLGGHCRWSGSVPVLSLAHFFFMELLPNPAQKHQERIPKTAQWTIQVLAPSYVIVAASAR
jgi:uncharacterized membrane protein YsdA (DUF1294 family)